MKITKEQIKALNPCTDGYKWFLKHGSECLLTTLLAVDKPRTDWARWLYTQLMTFNQRREFAIFAAEQVLPIFEKKYPLDGRPRAAIEAAKAVLKNNTQETRVVAANAANAANAAYAAAANAANAAAANAAYAAYAADAAAADAAADAADAAAAAAAYAANSANSAYAAADASAYARKEMQTTLIHKAVEILERGSRK